jgi:KTSC domain
VAYKPKHRAPKTYKNPEAAKRAIDRLRREGAQVEASDAASKLLGLPTSTPPAHVSPAPPTTGRVPAPVPSSAAALAAAEEAERAASLARSSFAASKDPTSTEFPHRPRSRSAEYDPATQVLRIWWDRPGRLGPYTNYYNVTPQEWDQVENVVTSTGKYVNRVLNYKHYDYS